MLAKPCLVLKEKKKKPTTPPKIPKQNTTHSHEERVNKTKNKHLLKSCPFFYFHPFINSETGRSVIAIFSATETN